MRLRFAAAWLPWVLVFAAEAPAQRPAPPTARPAPRAQEPAPSSSQDSARRPGDQETGRRGARRDPSREARDRLGERHLERRVQSGQAGPEELRRWWEGLDPERREEFRERYERLQRLGPEQRAELQRRHAQLERMRAGILESLSPEERARLEAMPPEERRRFVDQRLRERLHAEAERVRRERPEAARDLERKPVEERLREGRRRHEARRREWLLRRAERLQQEGYLGQRILEELRDPGNSPDAFLPAIFEAQKLQVLDREAALLREWGLDAGQERQLRALPGREFHQAWRALERGASFGEALEAARNGDGNRRFRDAPEGPRRGGRAGKDGVEGGRFRERPGPPPPPNSGGGRRDRRR